MNRQREQARAAAKFKMAPGSNTTARQRPPSTATSTWSASTARWSRSMSTASQVEGEPGDDVVIVLDHTLLRRERRPGRRQGELRNGTTRVLRVDDTHQDPGRRCSATTGRSKARSKVGDRQVSPASTPTIAARTMRNHSVTHLMHKALREVLGGHVQQKGRWSNAERTRFDFAHNAPMTDADPRRSRRSSTPRSSPTPPRARWHRRRRAEDRRDDAVRREVRRRGARARHRLEPRAVRRHARAAHRRHRPVQDRRRERRGGRRAPRRGGDRRNALAFLQNARRHGDRHRGTLRAVWPRCRRASRRWSTRGRRSRKLRAEGQAGLRAGDELVARARSTLPGLKVLAASSTAPTPRRCARRLTSSRTS